MSMRPGLYGLNEPTLPQRPKSRLRKVFNVLCMIAAVVMVSLFVLSRMGGDNASLRGQAERYLSEATGYQAKIGKLNAISFYPLIGADMDDVIFKGAAGEAVAHFDHINFSTSFWSAASGSSLKTLDIKGGFISAGVVAPGELDISQFSVEWQNKITPKLIFKGEYNGKPVTMSADLAPVASWLGTTYVTFKNPAAFEVKAGDIKLAGHIITDFAGRSIKIEHFEAGEKLKPMVITLTLINEGFSTGAEGKIEMGDSVIDYDLSFVTKSEKRKISGTINADRFALDDLFKDGGLFDIYSVLDGFYLAGTTAVEGKGFDFSNLDINVDVDFDHLMKGGIDLGNATSKIQTKDNALSFDPVSGKIKDGILDGRITLDAKPKPAALALNMTIKGMDYTSLSPMISKSDDKRGHADVKLELGAIGNDGDALWTNLNGKMTVIAGPGGLKSPLVNLWGGGLANTLLPALKGGQGVMLNCGIGDFHIEKGRATAKTLFFDTDRVTVVGDGSINLAKSTIDMRLTPQSKDTAFLSAATAVNVRGNLEHPSIEPDALSLGKKLGGLFLGTINPVYLAFSLTDMGEADSHPCSAYIKK